MGLVCTCYGMLKKAINKTFQKKKKKSFPFISSFENSFKNKNVQSSIVWPGCEKLCPTGRARTRGGQEGAAALGAMVYCRNGDAFLLLQAVASLGSGFWGYSPKSEPLASLQLGCECGGLHDRAGEPVGRTGEPDSRWAA